MAKKNGNLISPHSNYFQEKKDRIQIKEIFIIILSSYLILRKNILMKYTGYCLRQKKYSHYSFKELSRLLTKKTTKL